VKKKTTSTAAAKKQVTKASAKSQTAAATTANNNAHFSFAASLTFEDGSGLNFQAPTFVEKADVLSTKKLLAALKENTDFLEKLLEKQMALRGK
jgi:hypothetical protein